MYSQPNLGPATTGNDCEFGGMEDVKVVTANPFTLQQPVEDPIQPAIASHLY